MSDQQKSSAAGAWPVVVSAVIFDWAGTILDFGCIAPVAAFREAFTRTGIAISEFEARQPMGAAKREHVEAILAQPTVQERWLGGKGRASTQADVDLIYGPFCRSMPPVPRVTAL